MRFRKLLRVESLEDRAVPSTYFVSPTGSNANVGTTASMAWLTLQHAANQVQPGDTVWVLPGNYVGFNLTTSGTATSRIEFRAQAAGVNITSPNTWNNVDGINLEGASFVTIEGFTVNNMPRTGIRSVVNQFVTIRGNSMDNNGRWGILTGFSDDLTIEYNTTSRSIAEHGIYVSNSGDRPVIRGNLSWGNRSNGIHMNGDANLGGDGIISNAVVENNILHGNGVGGGSGINCDGVQNSVIRNNLIYNTHASGISLYRINGGGGSSGNVVVNNTVLVSSTGRWALNIADGSINNTVRNNILFSAHSFRGAVSVSTDSQSGLVMNYNAVEDRFSTDGGNTTITLSAWRTQTGQDANSFVIADPSTLFVNSNGGDYHLKSGSLVIDQGTTASAPLFDYEGHNRPQGNGVDIGHDEFNLQPSPPSPPSPPVPPPPSTPPRLRPRPRPRSGSNRDGVMVSARDFLGNDQPKREFSVQPFLMSTWPSYWSVEPLDSSSGA